MEPQIEFWSRLKQMASRAAERIGALRYEGTYTLVTNWPALFDPVTGNFAPLVARLETLAKKELAGECFMPDEEQFIDGLMEERGRAGGGGPWSFSGW